MKISIGLSIPVGLLLLAGLHLMCQEGTAVTRNNGAVKPPPDAPITAVMATTVPAGPTQVRVSIVMVVHKKYGVLAHLTGKRDVTVTDEPYEAGKSWWDNPMVVFEDKAFPARVSARADADSIAGSGKSSNVSVNMTLVPHADITLNTLAASDCIKGTLAVTITTLSDYYDGEWTDVAVTKDKELVFDFDTSEKARPLEQTASETRTVPPFTFERYMRDQQKWEPKSAWPAKPKSGDWRCIISIKDAKLTLIGYRYRDRPAESTQHAAATRHQ